MVEIKAILSASGVERGELARHLGVSVPTVNRWLNGISTPNVYQFRAIAHFFGLPYEWFTEDEGGIPNVDDLAVKRSGPALGLPGFLLVLTQIVQNGGRLGGLIVDDAVNLGFWSCARPTRRRYARPPPTPGAG